MLGRKVILLSVGSNRYIYILLCHTYVYNSTSRKRWIRDEGMGLESLQSHGE